MSRTLSWILVCLTLGIGGSELHSAFGIADQHLNVAIGKSISRQDKQAIIYDKKNLLDGKDSTTSYLYFPLSLTITIDLGDSHTVRHVVIKLTPDSFREFKSVNVTLAYASHAGLPTLKHVFRTNECVKPKKHENDLFIINLFRCCGHCCSWKQRGIGRFLKVTFRKKSESNNAFGVHEIEVRGLKSPNGMNLALFKPVLQEHEASCKTNAFVANDAWTDELYTQIKRPPFRWRVDLGRAQPLGFVRFVYNGKWGSAKVILIDDVGREFPDNSCPQVRMEFRQKNTICCDTTALAISTRWLEVRGENSLPRLVEVFIYPRSFKLYLDECPKATTTLSTSTLSTKAPTSTLPKSTAASSILPLPLSPAPENVTTVYGAQPASASFRPKCDHVVVAAQLLCSMIFTARNFIS